MLGQGTAAMASTSQRASGKPPMLSTATLVTAGGRLPKDLAPYVQRLFEVTGVTYEAGDLHCIIEATYPTESRAISTFLRAWRNWALKSPGSTRFLSLSRATWPDT